LVVWDISSILNELCHVELGDIELPDFWYKLEMEYGSASALGRKEMAEG
jgi:hypothetical protein